VLALVLFASPVFGQAGSVGIYAAPDGYDCNLTDVAPGLATYYFVHWHFLEGATACQFWAPMPWCMNGAVYLSDTQVFAVTIGNSQTGVSIGYGACLASPIHVLSINFFVQGLSTSCCCYYVYGHPNSDSGEVEIVDCNNQLITASGYLGVINSEPTCLCGILKGESPSVSLSCINDPIPVEESTWGKLKSMYAE
jgi:hypothetical protein